jgi:signal transduction histidine kinase
MDTVERFTTNTKSRIDAWVDHTRPSLAIEFEELRRLFIDARRRGARFRYVTEISRENIHYCKQLLKMVDELRHLEGIKGNFYLSESEYIAPARLHERGKPASQIIYSNVNEIVEQQQYVFDSFWAKAIPAEQIIREIEEGITHYETRIIEDPNEIVREIRRYSAASHELSTCLTSGGLHYSHNYFFDIKKKLLDKQKKGEHKGIRYITNIDSSNIELAKLYVDSGIQLRHVKNLPPMSFGISDKEMGVTIEKMEDGQTINSFLISNEPLYLKHFASIFEEVWKNGIDASDRIKDIEKGNESQEIEIIQNPDEIQMRGFELVKFATNEILLLVPTPNSYHRLERGGALDFLNESAARGIRVKILTAMDDLIKKEVREARLLKRDQGKADEIQIRNIERLSQTKATILIVDRKFSLTVELKDDTKETFLESVGLSTYSNSKATVLSYISIFESLWLQTELYDNITQANRKLEYVIQQLEARDKMQNEFIKIAAHELRSPIQPLLGMSDVLRSKIKEADQIELLNVITRNAKRLQRLAEDILDVTRIESQTLKLNKEVFNLNDMITKSIEDSKNQIDKAGANIKIIYDSAKKDVFVVADRGRLNQVISNLLDNAIKFTEEGTITIETQEINGHEVILAIKDTGTGIDSLLLPRLFTKFGTKSDMGGTGLGLFIAKSIIEAHGGKIWAENNVSGKGTTFSLSLPVSET